MRSSTTPTPTRMSKSAYTASIDRVKAFRRSSGWRVGAAFRESHGRKREKQALRDKPRHWVSPSGSGWRGALRWSAHKTSPTFSGTALLAPISGPRNPRKERFDEGEWAIESLSGWPRLSL
jgi:hypothetical protein